MEKGFQGKAAVVLGPLLLKVQLAHICRTWGTLLASGVPILTGMRIVRELTDEEVAGLQTSADRYVAQWRRYVRELGTPV